MKTEREPAAAPYGAANLERRKHPRVAVNLVIEYWRVGEARTRIGCTGDISEGGVLLHLPEKIEVGQELGLRLFVDAGFDFLSIEAVVQVVWKAMDNAQDGGCWIGVRLVEISARDMCNMRTFLGTLAHLRIPAEIPSRLLLDLGIPLLKAGKELPGC